MSPSEVRAGRSAGVSLRFDLERTVRLFKQVLGRTAPKFRDKAAADRWTWIIIIAHTQMQPARPLAADLRGPLERPAAWPADPRPGPPQISGLGEP